ncbi:glutathione S-transferase family protein [Sabulicella glaciei]|uniref:Glutathione S-transferase C-terminal domain-containing protein n=1 Tax=Sabulicella glaciei TaxID=2984948 RepID=A0ABT3NWN6_9PROT|nr:glutathione S-transferase C-terminal domain-containing protein [Roseococcus sp. MDT2-1-1]MCW8086572.1 glutathione S-transferase C-terminal domain-containing protein [Roseococcus sp. MDT2-1-1]
MDDSIGRSVTRQPGLEAAMSALRPGDTRRHVGLPHIYGEAPAAVDAAKSYFLRQAQVVSDLLDDGRPWLMGEAFTGADILLTSCFGMALPYGLQLTETLTAYRARHRASGLRRGDAG